MQLIAAYLLLTIGGNTAPSAADITALLATVDIKPNAERLEKLLSELAGKDINEIIAAGSVKLASVPSGGGGGSAAAAPAAATGGAAAAVEKVEEKVEEKEESDDDMGFGLFD